MRARLTSAREIPDSIWRDALAAAPLSAALDAARQTRLRALCAQFLAHKRFSAEAGAQLDDLRCLLIAQQACLPVLELGFAALHGWREVIVYPGEFRVRHPHQDRSTGVISEQDETLIGEAWARGPVVLSWASISHDLAHPHDGFNVVVHEIAHKLDQLDGAMDGVPALPAGLSRHVWMDAFQRAFDQLQRQLDNGQHSPINAYAATNPEEYFAVTSEMHFSQPAQLAQAAPEVARLLTGLYGTPPRPQAD
ncbi:M90 family metallopeptidase [Metallibacterium sp.]